MPLPVSKVNSAIALNHTMLEDSSKQVCSPRITGEMTTAQELGDVSTITQHVTVPMVEINKLARYWIILKRRFPYNQITINLFKLFFFFYICCLSWSHTINEVFTVTDIASPFHRKGI